jgi:hypothetical protein
LELTCSGKGLFHFGSEDEVRDSEMLDFVAWLWAAK